MFLFWKQFASNQIKTIKANQLHSHHKKSYQRKEKLSPHTAKRFRTGTFFFAPLRASLTVEAALVLPLFLFAMIAALQYGKVMETAVKFGTALTETGKSLAAAAYVTRYGGDTSEVPEIAACILSEAYAQMKVTHQAGDVSAVKNTNMLLSSFLEEEETIDLVLTYQIRSPVSMISLPWNFFLQRARVRAWTGKDGGKQEGEEGEGQSDGETVYVTETGTVYHEDPDCTYLRLSIQSVDADALSHLRNKSGGKYYCCELCGEGNPSGTVYITSHGGSYHSSLSCSGLKRTVSEVSRTSAEHMKACSRCSRKS